jgi:ABC-type Zn uptake system ZnuABC Zn-binding protein ZnuA
LVGAFIPSADSYPRSSAAASPDIVGEIRAQPVPAVLADAPLNSELIKQVGRQADVKVSDGLRGDSLGSPESEAGTCVKVMRADTAKITAALKECML